jgi:hypothetical protein
MTRKEKLKILNGIIKGFRPINDVFADWPTKMYYMNDETDPPTFENDDGEPVTAREIDKQFRTYPKVKIRPMDYSPKDIKNYIRAGLKRMEAEEEKDDSEYMDPDVERENIITYEEIDERPLKPGSLVCDTHTGTSQSAEQVVCAPQATVPEPKPLPPNPPLKPEPPPKMYHIW